jgi:hypothetical protein
MVMTRQTFSSRRFRTVAVALLALGLTFSAGTVFGARRADPLLLDAQALLGAARVDLEIASGGAADAKSQRTYDRHIGRAIKSIDSALASIDDAMAAAGQ